MQRAVYLYPSEYNVYGLGATPSVTYTTDENGNWVKDFKITDHLGSVRLVLREGSIIRSQTDYEPFGEIRNQSLAGSRTSFIGKEKDKESNLGDFGVRKYDNGIGRFTSCDPLWEKYYGWTPYQYCRNNPLITIDPSGFADYYNNNAELLGNDGTINTDKYLTTQAEFDEVNNSDKPNWSKIQGNKAPTKETMDKVNSVIQSEHFEFALVQDKNGIPTDVKQGDWTNNCEASVDQTDLLNQTLSNGSSPDIMIHFHLLDRIGCTTGAFVSKGDKNTFNELSSEFQKKNIPAMSNSIMVNPNGFLKFYNGNGETLSISKEKMNEIVK